MHGLTGQTADRIALAERAPLQVADVRLDPATRMLGGPGGETQIEPRVMQVLLALADADGRVMTRDMLEKLCWQGLFVSEDSLTRAISAIRRALREVGSDRLKVETIPKTGYRLVAAPDEQTAAEPALPAAAPPPHRDLTRRNLLGGLAVAAVGAAGISAFLARRPKAVPEADELKAQGWDSWRQGLPDAESQGLGFVQEAARIAPQDAGAWGLVALLARNVWEMGVPEEAQAAFETTQSAIRRALAIDGREGNALAARAMMLPIFGDWGAARRRLDEVLAVRPDQVPALDALGVLHFSSGYGREGLAIAARLADADPLAAVFQHKLVYRLWAAGDIAQADRVADRALSLWPGHPAIWFARMWTYGYTGRAEAALRMIRQAVERRSLGPAMAELYLATFEAGESRRPADVARAVELNRAAALKAPGAAVASVQHLAWLGDLDGAFEVARGYLQRQGPAVGSLQPDPTIAPTLNEQHRRKTMMLFIPATAPMRADPRFLTLAEEIGLTRYWEAAGRRPDFLSG